MILIIVIILNIDPESENPKQYQRIIHLVYIVLLHMANRILSLKCHIHAKNRQMHVGGCYVIILDIHSVH